MTWLKKILGITRLEEQIKNLRGVIDIQEMELKNYRGYSNYVTLPVPDGNAITQHLADLGNQKMTMFYLMAKENTVMALFRNSKDKDADLHKGALRMLDNIREDMNAARAAIERKNVKV